METAQIQHSTDTAFRFDSPETGHRSEAHSSESFEHRHDALEVLHSFPTWLPTTQTWMYNQVKYLPHHITPHVVCERVENLDEFGIPHIHCFADLPRWRRTLDSRMRKHSVRRHLSFTRRMVKRIEPQVFHSHFGPIAWKNMGAVRATGAKHVCTFYGYDVTFWPGKDERNPDRYRELFASIDVVFCEGSVMAKRIRELGCGDDKVIVHHLGVPLDRIFYEPRSWRPGTPFRVLISGRFREKKGIPVALRALGAIRDEVDLEITIIGDALDTPSDRAEKAKIMAMLEECGLDGKTRMMGFQPYSVFLEEARHHHVFLSPSVTAADGDTEGGAPVAIIEMAASGMPIVSSFHCDIPEVILDGETGWLAPERDWQHLAEHLRWLITHPDDWRPFQDASRKRIEDEYNCRIQGARLARHYERLALA